MPGPLPTWHELDQAAVAPDEEMGRNFQVPDFGIVRVCPCVEAIGEQRDDAVAVILAWRQADVVDDDEADIVWLRSRIAIGRGDEAGCGGDAMCIDDDILHA